MILAEETGVDVGDLEEAFLGFMDYGSEGSVVLRNTASGRIAAGIREERWVIDLYVWIEKPRGVLLVLPAVGAPYYQDRTEPAVKFRCTSERGCRLAKKCFGWSERAPDSGEIQVIEHCRSAGEARRR